jgi:hypothetical protein
VARRRAWSAGGAAEVGCNGRLDVTVYGLRGKVGQPRVLVGLVLIAGGIVWAIARGLRFYGLTPAHLGYDLDQPPLLLLLVGTWLLFRSRRL